MTHPSTGRVRVRASAPAGQTREPRAAWRLAAAVITLCVIPPPSATRAQAAEDAPRPVPLDSAEAILQSFADDYALDPSLKRPVTFAVALDHDVWWHVVAQPADSLEAARVNLVRGRPPEPSLLFSLHYPALVRIHRGEISAATAMGRGLASDPALMSFGAMHGYSMTPEFRATLFSLAFHFWTRGLPEIIAFDSTRTRHLHGTDAVLLYYEPGFRSGWFSLKPGQHANADPRLQVNPFSTMLVITKGRGAGRVGGREMELGEGHAVFIPAGVSHEFWNPFDETAERLLLMFGEGA